MKVSDDLLPSLIPSDLSSAEGETQSSSPQQWGSPATHTAVCSLTTIPGIAPNSLYAEYSNAGR